MKFDLSFKKEYTSLCEIPSTDVILLKYGSIAEDRTTSITAKMHKLNILVICII